MNKPWIEAFVSVCQTQNVSQAARNLFLAQPTVSNRIQALEQELGEQLFLRTDRKMKLTASGEAFLPYARQLLDTWESGQEAVQKLRGQISGEITVALFYSAISRFTPCFIQFTTAYPDVNLVIKLRHSEEVGDLVLNRIADIGIARTLDHPSLQSRRLLADSYVLVASPEYGDGGVPFIAQYSSHFDKDALERFLKEHEWEARPRVETDNLEVARLYVLNNAGMAFMPRFYVEEDIRQGRMILLESVPDSAIHSRSIDAIWMKEGERRTIVTDLLEHITRFSAIRQI